MLGKPPVRFGQNQKKERAIGNNLLQTISGICQEVVAELSADDIGGVSVGVSFCEMTPLAKALPVATGEKVVAILLVRYVALR